MNEQENVVEYKNNIQETNPEKYLYKKTIYKFILNDTDEYFSDIL